MKGRAAYAAASKQQDTCVKLLIIQSAGRMTWSAAVGWYVCFSGGHAIELLLGNCWPIMLDVAEQILDPMQNTGIPCKTLALAKCDRS